MRLGLVVLLLLGACGPGPIDRAALESVPTPDLSAVESAVRDRLASARQAFDQDQSGDDRRALAEAYLDLGRLYHAHAQLAAATVAYRNAVALRPDDPEGAHLLGHTLLSAGDPAAALEHFRLASQKRPDLAVWIAHGRAAAAAGLLDEAREALAHAQAQIPTAMAHMLLGDIASEAGDPSTAIEHYRAALALQPEASVVQLPLAVACRANGDVTCAEEALSRRGRRPVAYQDPWLAEVKALEVGARADSERGVVAMRQGRLDEAEQAFRSALETDADNLAARANLGAVLLRRDRLDEARMELQAVLDADPQLDDARFNLARLEARAGDDPAAVEQYRRVLDQDAGHVDARFNLANALLRIGRFEECAGVYRSVNDSDPKRVPARLGEIVCLRLAGDELTAWQRVQVAIQEVPTALPLRNAAARLAATGQDERVRDPVRALVDAQALFAKASSLEHVVTLAMAHAANGAFGQAVSWQEAALQAVRQSGRTELLPGLDGDLERYRSRLLPKRPWRGVDFGARW